MSDDYGKIVKDLTLCALGFAFRHNYFNFYDSFSENLVNYRNLQAIFICIFIAACTQTETGFPNRGELPADIIFTGNNIVTVDESLRNVSAVAVRGEKIVAAGPREEVLVLRGDNTRVIELGEQALVPGFIDAHGHMAYLARLINFVNLSSPPVGVVETMDDVITLIKRHIDAKQIAPSDWVFGYGYDDSLIAENRHPTRDDLDQASDQHPIVLTHVSGHLAAVNSMALELAGVDADSEDPPGGVIRRRLGTREPNGVLEETAAFTFNMERGDGPDPDELADMFRQSANLYASYGITTVQDGGSALSDIEIFREAAAHQPFPVDVVAFPVANRLDETTLNSIKLENNYTGGFRVGGVKFVLDGSPQGRTAYLSQPYNEGPPGAGPNYRAYPSYPAEQYNDRVARMISKGIPVLVHANGDAAIDMMIDGVAGALDQEDTIDHRSVIIHAQLTRADQLPLIKRLGIVPSYYAAHPFFWGDWHRRSFGEERAAHISPVGSTLKLGIPLTVHNDAPIVPPDMMRLLWITVNRKTRSGYVLGPDQRATPLEALHAITLGAAYQYFEEDKKGSITPGKRADLVVLEVNPLTIDPEMIKNIAVIETFASGKSVYKKH